MYRVNQLFKLQDLTYRDFHAKLVPTVDKDRIIGIRTPELRKLAKEMVKQEDYEDFLKELPHQYFDEDQLHAFILSELKDYDRIIRELDTFLPLVDNWATCDQLSPKIFKKHKQELLGEISRWLTSQDTYVVRFAIGMLMQHYLDNDFKEEYLETVSRIHSEEYYINMMSAWYFATALAKQYESAIKYIEGGKLDIWVHNKAIQKARESYRITPEKKEYLKTLKR